MRLLFAAILASGCIDLGALKARDAGDDGGDGAAPVDAAPRPDLAGNLISNGDFEHGVTPWLSDRGAVTLSEDAHSGAHAARICARGTTPFNFYYDLPATAGATYSLDLWVRLQPPEGFVDTGVYLQPFVVAGRTIVEPHGHGTLAATDAWQEVTTQVTVAAPADSLEVNLSLTAGPLDGGMAAPCFEVDDVYLSAG